MDYPNYQNVGDSAIWLGMAKLLREVTGRLPSFTGYTDYDIKLLGKKAPEGPIFICGGGNFGDVWRGRDDIRYKLMQAYPGRQIVQMPQSIQFRDPENLEFCKRQIAAHGKFHLMTRDHRSFELAKSFDCPVQLLPDTAFGIGKMKPVAADQFHTLYMLRDDREKGLDISEVIKKVEGPVWDWMGAPKDLALRQPQSGFKALARGSWRKYQVRAQHHEDVTARRVNYGIKLLSAGNRIVTDRLHIHIFSVLMNVPHVALDNNYGKVHGYIDAWTSATPLVQKATTPEEVLQAMSRLPYEASGAWYQQSKPLAA
ncbi:polysaccharide pyruvyl transferase family protein [Rhizobium sp. 1AS11]|nr:polysaccharide pyruvyl transferase family protein [Rhizobium acaciae]MCW1744194.1 polysaccharide pyruvyl transferase family protein [Rhizobium acaciae]